MTTDVNGARHDHLGRFADKPKFGGTDDLLQTPAPNKRLHGASAALMALSSSNDSDIDYVIQQPNIVAHRILAERRPPLQLSVDQYEGLAEATGDPIVLRSLSANGSFSQEWMEEHLDSHGPMLAAHDSTPDYLIDRLMVREDLETRTELSERDNLTSVQLGMLSQDPFLGELVEEGQWMQRHVDGMTDAQLKDACRLGSLGLKAMCAERIGLDDQTVAQLVTGSSWQRETAVRYGRLTHEQVDRLVTDSDSGVRLLMTECEDLTRDQLQTLTADTDKLVRDEAKRILKDREDIAIYEHLDDILQNLRCPSGAHS